jgi:chemotaxis signal transduction protein
VIGLGFQESGEAELRHPDRTFTLRLFRLGTERFALFAKEIDEITPWRRPTPLPAAPEAILGIVSVQPRMITVLDTSRLMGNPQITDLIKTGCVIVLSGQEQLGLTATAEETSLEVSPAEIEVASKTDGRPLLGFVSHQGEKIHILDPPQLFAAAIRGHERRRRQL